MSTFTRLTGLALLTASVIGCGGNPTMPKEERDKVAQQTTDEIMTKSPEEKVRYINLLGRMGRESAHSLAQLEQLQNDPNPNVKKAAKEAIAQIQADGGE